jgi:hypothetical protein
METVASWLVSFFVISPLFSSFDASIMVFLLTVKMQRRPAPRVDVGLLNGSEELGLRLSAN